MATIYKEFLVNAPPEFVWEAIKDVAAVHTRLAQGFVTDTSFAEDVRTVTFANGMVVREQIVTIDDGLRRLAYAAVGGHASHHNAYFEVFAGRNGRSRVLWVTDFLPENIRAAMVEMVDVGSSAIQQTLEKSFQEQQNQFKEWVVKRLRNL